MKGIIGFFDILGYQSFLKNNSAEESVNVVLNSITGVPEEVGNIIKKVSETMGAKAGKEIYVEVAASIKHIVFSDTIVLTMPYPIGPDTRWMQTAIVVMSAYAGRLAAEMFRSGLPLRGVLHEGEFFSKDMCLAGRGIVEAYHLCESLNFSGIVFSSELEEEISKDPTMKPTNDSRYRFRYLTPLKDGKEEKMLNLLWLDYLKKDVDEYERCKRDVEDYVLKSFWSHQKDCPSVVDIKIKNTVKVMRKMIQNKEAEAPPSAKKKPAAKKPAAKKPAAS